MAWDGFSQAMGFQKSIRMLLKAISIGCAIPRTDFDATVHSVFRSAINLRPSSGQGLLTLVSSSQADLPQGIRLEIKGGFSFEKFSVGDQATCHDMHLCIDTFTIDMRDARCWKCDLPALHADLSNPVTAAAWKYVWLMLNQRQIQSQTGIIAQDLFRSDGISRPGWAGKAMDAMRDLYLATRRYDLSLKDPVRDLIGLGSGLTPSGDDLLVGYLAGLWSAVRSNNTRLQYVRNLGKTIMLFARRTNDISRTFLFHASHGQVSSLLGNLAEAISRGETSDCLLGSTESAIRLGHTSGMETVTGLLMGLFAWEGDVPA
jgi:hypothetical protein